jgi:hypothetical protein
MCMYNRMLKGLSYVFCFKLYNESHIIYILFLRHSYTRQSAVTAPGPGRYDLFFGTEKSCLIWHFSNVQRLKGF